MPRKALPDNKPVAKSKMPADVQREVTGQGTPPTVRKYRDKDPRGLKPYTVILDKHNIAHLNGIAYSIQQTYGLTPKQAPERSTIIRALVDALETAGLDLTACQNEIELRRILTAKLSG